jgi:hypothetical protein
MERLHAYDELDSGTPLLGTSGQARLPDGHAEQVRNWWAQFAEAEAKGVFTGGHRCRGWSSFPDMPPIEGPISDV